MREHGVLDRVLLIYEECGRRIETHVALPPGALGAAANLLARFIEEYHEKNEEQFVFPRVPQMAGLVKVLREQHLAGRKVTAAIERLAPTAGKDQQALEPIRQFVRMYRPHAAREDTVLFPAFHDLLGKKEIEEMGDKLEDQEHKLFGPKGFEHVVEELAGIERTLGIENLAQFTPAG